MTDGSSLDPWYTARNKIETVLREDLMCGPGCDSVDEPPLDRFIVGILHPRERSSMDEILDTPEVEVRGGAQEGEFNPAVSLSRLRQPSSMGMTFAVNPRESPSLVVRVEAVRFVQDETASEPAGVRRWRAVRPEFGPVVVDMNETRMTSIDVEPGLRLTAVVRTPVAGVRSVTVVLVNTHQSPAGRRDHLCWFSPKLIVSVESGGFVDRPASETSALNDEDVASQRLLYRRVRNLAVGHGVAADWTDEQTVRQLQSTYIPAHDVPTAVPGGSLALPMVGIAGSEGLTVLSALVHLYEKWIEEREAEIPSSALEDREIAQSHVSEARIALERIQAGIDLLQSDHLALQAFQLMNVAMAQQRSRQEMIRAGETGTPSASIDAQQWRPFQIAFILINLPGLSDPECDDRRVADLLWFPTGGGKTEAYLGLVAFSILLRRLRAPDAVGGVSVLMRYTLRLLTLQQFERAAGLICSLEELRRRELPSSAPISIGLWVGQGGTPNDIDGAAKALRELRRGATLDAGNPVQLLKCPWCGARLGLDEYRIVSGPDRMIVRCSDADCAFGDALPVHLVDDDVYRERPSLLISTVDKFAMAAWRPQVREFFFDGVDPQPPDLVIQDELHLISGPLGTMVGLYESALDGAMSRGARPKIVASTATIRRASQQVTAVFDRTTRQFPPPGLDASDSFFAVEASAGVKASRRYVGVLAPGSSQTTLLVRSYAALLQAGKDLDATDEVRDAYWTLVGYFNSLRVLGGAFIQVNDDVPDRIQLLAQRMGTSARELGETHELTSRKPSSEIPLELEALGTAFPHPECPDVVLATNMISVGVDVDRLGLMVVAGQPQSTSEYIQATSRVGRQHPGLVVTLYNAGRSRDLSHYESFPTYHRALYRQVEAVAATPFAARARDRGLHGVLVALARLNIVDANPDLGATGLEAWSDELRPHVEQLIDRVRRVAPDQADHAEAQIEDLIDEWDRWTAVAGPSGHYAGWRDSRSALLSDPSRSMDSDGPAFPVGEPPWPTLTSLRDVDAESYLFLLRPRER